MQTTFSKNTMLLAAMIVFSIGLVMATYVASKSYLQSKYIPGTISVTGSAKKELVSDLAVWQGTFSVQAKTLPEAYKLIKTHQTLVEEYLLSKNLKKSDISMLSINTMINYAKNFQGMYTSEIESYRLSQSVEVKHSNVNNIAQIARESTELIDKGIEFQSNPPQYFYTKIADVKVDMLALATKDAKARAEQIASNAGSQLDALKTGRMGVFQITPKYSNTVSDYGVNDTSTIEKEIMAVVNCDFKLK